MGDADCLPKYAAVVDESFCRAIEERLAHERPLREGDRWRATPFESTWAQVVPVGRSLYAGGYLLAREDGVIASISSNLAIHGVAETKAVIREIGATATAEEIQNEIQRRTEAAWADE